MDHDELAALATDRVGPHQAGRSSSGHAVFQLRAGTHRIHPMALTFPTRDPRRLFFPTVHLHDGQFHARARFDHKLYFQRRTGPRQELGNEQRPEPTDAVYEEWRSVELTMSSLNQVSRKRAAASYEGLTAVGQPVVLRALYGVLVERRHVGRRGSECAVARRAWAACDAAQRRRTR